jgi:flavin-dependent dehydrogenase
MCPLHFSPEGRISLESSSKIIIIGGGPSGAFFAREMLRRAHSSGRQIEVSIIEQKKTPRFYQTACPSVYREGCNFCAGGISPRMSDVLKVSGLEVPKEVVTGEIETVIVQGDWKHIELKVPSGRRMFSVHRGSRPAGRTHQFENFDSYLLSCAVAEGARIFSGEVDNVSYSDAGRPLVHLRAAGESDQSNLSMEADFVVFAAGVNPTAGVTSNEHPLVKILEGLIPGFTPPLVRRALIFELRPLRGTLSDLHGEVYFVQYGAADLEIETASFISKKEFVTVSLLGPCVDTAHPSNYLSIIKQLLQLPHIRRLLPRNLELGTVCLCSPNMTVGTASHPFGHRIAVIGDLAVARLYKDGILSAYQTANALVDCLLKHGLDQGSLKKNYWPAVRQFTTDNRFGRFVFWANRVAFRHPILSRILYQAVLTERKGKADSQRRLENLLWRTAAGDDTYRSIFFSMWHPANLWAILVGGILVTARNYLTEALFGLKWRDFGRYPTGVYLEELEGKRQEVQRELHLSELHGHMDFERMYSIQIKAEKAHILRQLERFGAEDMEYFRPRWVRIRRSRGQPNAIGTIIRYETAFHFVDFSLKLEKFLREEFILYRVQDGFASKGVLIFDIKKKRHGVFILSIYVAFNMPRGQGLLRRMYWNSFRHLFPGFVHDVLWNHSLCKIKDIAETSGSPGAPEDFRPD